MNRTKSDAGNEQKDYRPHSQAGDSTIIYTVTDVSMVEQGAGGFVKAVKGILSFSPSPKYFGMSSTSKMNE